MIQAEVPATQGLEAAVQAYRLRFEVMRESDAAGGVRRVSALEVWLWATLPRGAAALPESPACRAAVRAVTRVAEAAVAPGAGVRDAEVEPYRHQIYDSRQAPGCDELYVAIRVRWPFGAGGAEAPPEPRLRELRRRLEVLGVFEGRWHARVPPPAEPWMVRSTAAAFAPAAPAPAPGPPAKASTPTAPPSAPGPRPGT